MLFYYFSQDMSLEKLIPFLQSEQTSVKTMYNFKDKFPKQETGSIITFILTIFLTEAIESKIMNTFINT
jgi:hypothetical protein